MTTRAGRSLAAQVFSRAFVDPHPVRHTGAARHRACAMADMNVRPIMINGVDNVAARPDVADWWARPFAAHPASKRRRKRYLTNAFDQALPRIHGSIPAPL